MLKEKGQNRWVTLSENGIVILRLKSVFTKCFGSSGDEEVNPTARVTKRKRTSNKPEGVRVKNVRTPILSNRGVSRQTRQT